MGKAIAAYEDRMKDGQTRLHRFRYHCSRGFCDPEDVVVDLGSGSGYGSDILARVANKVIGIDIDGANVRDSQNKYGCDNLEFMVGDMEKMDIPEADVFVAMETIEHTYNPQAVLDKLKQKSRRLIIMSVPIGVTTTTDSSHHFDFLSWQAVRDMVVDDEWELFYVSHLHVSVFLVFFRKEQYGL
jgi:protein-L-isoaspartate O-methyltransferase